MAYAEKKEKCEFLMSEGSRDDICQEKGMLAAKSHSGNEELTVVESKMDVTTSKDTTTEARSHDKTIVDEDGLSFEDNVMGGHKKTGPYQEKGIDEGLERETKRLTNHAGKMCEGHVSRLKNEGLEMPLMILEHYCCCQHRGLFEMHERSIRN